MPSSVANIVATQSITAQTASFGPTTVYTPSASGLFRVNLYAEQSGAGDVEVSVGYTDDYGAKSYGQNGIPWQSSATIRSTASAITVTETLHSGTPTFSVYVVIEQLA